MTKILFICHGNICRSTMAEFVMKDLVKKAGLEKKYHIASAGTSSEELGNPVHRGTRRVLGEHGIKCDGKYAVQMAKSDYGRYDHLIGMERTNVRNILRITGGDPEGKVCRLLDFTGQPRDIDDPWYSGRFEETYVHVLEGCQALLQYLEEDGV